ncbi:hypothetical protein NMY22_g17163 [Coprinellus aureogranulatus]|nr:hypothetical protein NMY22_g17163 [Coprinellus aureogranulatus]
MSTTCSLPATREIAEVGIRLGMYLQSIVCFTAVVWAIRDGRAIAHWDLRSIEALSVPNLVLGIGFLIPSIIQASVNGMTDYLSATLALRMTWMANINASAILLLHSWCQARRSGVALGAAVPLDAEAAKAWKLAVSYRLHLCCMAFLGLWTWINPRTMGGHESTCKTGAVPSIPGAGMQQFGPPSLPLRAFSIAMYGLVLIAGVNFLPVMAFLRAAPRRYSTVALTIGFGILATINLLLLIDIELTLRRHEQWFLGGEKPLIAGQVFSIVSVLMSADPLFTLSSRREESTMVVGYFEVISKDGIAVPVVINDAGVEQSASATVHDGNECN